MLVAAEVREQVAAVAAEVREQAAVVAAEVREQAVVVDVVQGEAAAVEVWEQTVVVIGVVWKAAVVAAVDLVREQALWVDEQRNPARSKLLMYRRGQFFSARRRLWRLQLTLYRSRLCGWMNSRIRHVRGTKKLLMYRRGHFFSARDISKCYFHCQLVIQMSVSKVFIHGVKIIHQTICASVKRLCWF